MLKASKLNGSHANELLLCPHTTKYFYVGLQQCIKVSNIRCYVKTHFTFTADGKILRLTSPDWRFFPRIKLYSTNITPPYSGSRHRFRIVWLTYPLVSCKYIFCLFRRRIRYSSGCKYIRVTSGRLCYSISLRNRLPPVCFHHSATKVFSAAFCPQEYSSPSIVILKDLQQHGAEN